MGKKTNTEKKAQPTAKKVTPAAPAKRAPAKRTTKQTLVRAATAVAAIAVAAGNAVAKKRRATAAKKTASPKKLSAKKATVTSPIEFTHEEIELRAYFIAERKRAGGVYSDPADDWVEAERELQQEAKQTRTV